MSFKFEIDVDFNIILEFNLIKEMSQNNELIVRALNESKIVEVYINCFNH